ncbi:MAG: cyclomaltodextrinase C-terminal domain-containing protein, partial [Bacteroidota bacterium]
MKEGWFDTHMPDLNLDNPHLAKYFIQNSLWWIEWAGIDAYRIDTYAYPEQKFMSEWAKAILEEYPQFSLFGETWVHGTPVQAWFTEETANKEFNSYLPGVTDFQLHYALNHALTNDFGWTEGVARIYYTLAKDYVYKDASKNVIFLDNHDVGRFASTINEDMDAYKMGLGFLLTTRGIPQVYYGTELMMPNSSKRERDDRYREEFSGGWEGDKENKFEASGRTKKEQEAFEYFRTLAQFRKSSKALTEGKLMQFVPENGVYVYFRYHPEETVMIVMNQNKEDQKITTNRFTERMTGHTSAVNVITDKTVKNLKTLNIPGRSVEILKLVK